MEFLNPLIQAHGFDLCLSELLVFVDYIDVEGVNLGVGDAVDCLILVYRIPLLEALWPYLWE